MAKTTEKRTYEYAKAPTSCYVLRRRGSYSTGTLYLVNAETPQGALAKHMEREWYDAAGEWEVLDGNKLSVIAAFNVTESINTEIAESEVV